MFEFMHELTEDDLEKEEKMNERYFELERQMERAEHDYLTEPEDDEIPDPMTAEQAIDCLEVMQAQYETELEQLIHDNGDTVKRRNALDKIIALQSALNALEFCRSHEIQHREYYDTDSVKAVLNTVYGITLAGIRHGEIALSVRERYLYLICFAVQDAFARSTEMSVMHNLSGDQRQNARERAREYRKLRDQIRSILDMYESTPGRLD